MSAAALSKSQTSTEWVISPTVAEKTGMPLDMILGAFKQAQIPLTIVDKWPTDREVIKIQTEPRVDLFANFPEVVWENGECQVLFVTERDRAHLVFRPKDDVCFENITKEKFLALRHKMKVIPDVFEIVFGSPDYCEQLIESASAFAYEIFPDSGEEAANVVDLVGKDKRNLYLLTRGTHQSYSLPKDKLESLNKEFVLALNSNKCLTPRIFTRKREEINMNQALDFRVNAFAKLLEEQGAFLALVKSAGVYQNDQVKTDSRPHITTKCIFGNPPEKELLYKNDHIQVILNPKPYVGWNETNTKHVLVVPTRHVEDCTNVTDAEFLSERLAILNVCSVWKKLFPNHEYFIWKQQGIKAGQTVPHLHTQVLCAKSSEIWEYYKLMIQDISSKNVPLVFAPCPDLRQGLQNALWS